MIQLSQTYTDAELIADIQSGQHTDRALRFIYREYYHMLESLVLQNSGSEADAEDVMQEVLIVFVEMVRKQKYEGRASVKSFLYTLTRNMWISELRKKGSANRRHEVYESEKESFEADISEYLAHKEGQQIVERLFEELGKKCQQILTLFYYEEMPMKEVLQHTDFDNEQVLRNKKYKCLKSLIQRVHQSPVIFDQLKQALRHGK
ncbi:MAG: RNA polymerase sigma factor [Cyclobacteriaceae bacterium]